MSTKKNSLAKKYAAVDDFGMTIADSGKDVPDLDSTHSNIKYISRDKPTRPQADEISKGRKRHKRLAAGGGDGGGGGDNGGLDSDFKFMGGGEEGNVGEYDGWAFEGAQEAMRSGRGGVDVDDIIRRRTGEAEEVEENEDEETEDKEEEVEFTGFGSDDEALGLMGLGCVLWKRIQVGRINLGLRRMRMETKRTRGRRRMGRG